MEERERLRDETRALTQKLTEKEERLGELEGRLASSEKNLETLAEELSSSEDKLQRALARAEDVVESSSEEEAKFARKLAEMQTELESSKRRTVEAAAASAEAKMARDDALEDLRRAQIEASKEAQRLTEAHDDDALESNAEVRRLEGEHAKLVSQLKHAEATISEYIVVSTAQLDSVVNEQRVAFELEAKSLREQLQGTRRASHSFKRRSPCRSSGTRTQRKSLAFLRQIRARRRNSA